MLSILCVNQPKSATESGASRPLFEHHRNRWWIWIGIGGRFHRNTQKHLPETILDEFEYLKRSISTK